MVGVAKAVFGKAGRGSESVDCGYFRHDSAVEEVYMKIIQTIVFSISFLVAGTMANANVLTTKHNKVTHEHKHQHGPNCGHKAEKHGDHVDYEEIVDGKLHHHFLHGDHYDECTGPEGKTASNN